MCLEESVTRLQILQEKGVPEAQGIDLELVVFAIKLKDQKKVIYPN